MTTVRLDVDGMQCGGCASRVEAALSDVDGVDRVEVSLERGEATVEGVEPTSSELVAAVEATGYEARVRSEGAPSV